MDTFPKKTITLLTKAMLIHVVLIASLMSFANGSILGGNFRKMCLCRCGVTRNKVYPYHFPWLAVVDTGSQLFGGTLITDQHVLTVASALFGLPYAHISITLGSHDRCGGGHSMNISASLISINPGYSPARRAGDLALIKLRYPVTFNDFISPVCLPYFGMQDYGLVAWTSVWRLNSDSSSCLPRVAISPTFPASSCVGSVDSELLTPDKGCFDPLGARNSICELDQGAPVLWRRSSHFPFRLIGVVSSSPSCPLHEPNSTTVYTKVNDYLSWIYDKIRSDCNCF